MAFGLPRAALYQWERALRDGRPVGPAPRAGVPRWQMHMRERQLGWGKDKLVLPRQQGWQVSTSMVCCILTRMKASGVI